MSKRPKPSKFSKPTREVEVLESFHDYKGREILKVEISFVCDSCFEWKKFKTTCFPQELSRQYNWICRECEYKNK